MQDPIKFIPINAELYRDFYLKTQELDFGPILLPAIYTDKLWGIIACLGENVIAGWVGQLRGDIPVVRCFSKGIWFDSLPVIFDMQENDTLFFNLIDNAKSKAKSDGIVLFNVTHWSRHLLTEKTIFNDVGINATYILSIKKDTDTLWKETDSTLRNKVRKAEKKEVEVSVLNGQEAILYLDIFQQLRGKTQERALNKNSKASMLLKSDYYFNNILQKSNSYLFIAKYNNEIASMALMIQSGKTMYYYSGGSDIAANKKTGASSSLIWKAIAFAQKSGLEYFDMGGVPVMPEKNHPAYGVYEFKKSFGGEYKEFSSGKIVINQMKYNVLNIVLKNQAMLRKLSKKE